MTLEWDVTCREKLELETTTEAAEFNVLAGLFSFLVVEFEWGFVVAAPAVAEALYNA